MSHLLQMELQKQLQSAFLGLLCSKGRPPAVIPGNCSCDRCTTTRPPRSSEEGVSGSCAAV